MQVGVKAGDRFSPELCQRLLAEEYEKLRKASNRDVHDASKNTTLPIAREIVETYVTERRQTAVVHRPAQHQPRKPRPDGGQDGESACSRKRFARMGRRITENLDFGG